MRDWLKKLIKKDEPTKPNESDDIVAAKNIILESNKTTASYLQRRMSIGYHKAYSIIEQLERDGFLSAPNSDGLREIINPQAKINEGANSKE